ncbi:MAG: hypothetical protein IKS17_09555 [Firmicutes bacterium]|nr:hypothetical protein [Bacillota bacterium]
MKHLKTLMESVDFTTGRAKDELLLDGQKEKYDRIAVFAGDDFIFAYNYTGRSFKIDTSKFENADVWHFSPVSGISSYVGRVRGNVYAYKKTTTPSEGCKDVVVIIKAADRDKTKT